MQYRHESLIEVLDNYFKAKELEADMPMLERLPTERLIDSLTMALPFGEQSKQMLLETVEPGIRLDNFIALLQGEMEIPDSVTRH